MFSDLFAVVYRHAQTLAKEDILTALLATMFESAPRLIDFFFSHKCVNCPEEILGAIQNRPEVRTGITEFLGTEPDQRGLGIRPDLQIASGAIFHDSDVRMILIESKLHSSLTKNQYQGYPELRRKYAHSCFVMLISNYRDPDHADYFDRVLSWHKVHAIVSAFVVSLPASDPIALVLAELLEALTMLGFELNPFLLTDLERNRPADDIVDIPTFVKMMRKNLGLTQQAFAKEVRVGLRFIRDLEQGKKTTLRSDKLNQVLARFNAVLAPVYLTSDGQRREQAEDSHVLQNLLPSNAGIVTSHAVGNQEGTNTSGGACC
jgi:transcriptional regulator with XRE-family HTH domain